MLPQRILSSRLLLNCRRCAGKGGGLHVHAGSGSSLGCRMINLNPQRNKSRFAFPEGMKAHEDDYTETPEYPPIDPETRKLSDRAKAKRQKVLDYEDSIKYSGTVEEKLILLNRYRKYGWKSVKLTEDEFGYDCFPYYQFITRTHLVPDYQLPDLYDDPELSKMSQSLLEKLKGPLLELLSFELEGIERKRVKELGVTGEFHQQEIQLEKTRSIVHQVNRLLIAVLSQEVPHLRTCQVDFKPKLEAFWNCGGMEPKIMQINSKKGYTKFLKENYPKIEIASRDPEEPVERSYQYLGNSILQLRCINPIKNIVDAGSHLCMKGDQIPERMRYTHYNYGLRIGDYRYATILPGHWTGDDHRSSLLSIHPQHHLYLNHKSNNQYMQEDQQSALDSQAVMVSFSRLLAQAYNFGFDQFSDVDYPFSTQTITTDGLNWSFYAYQLNTMALDNTRLAKNKRQNICWGTKPMKILEDGVLNEKVVENLVKFYLNPPTPIQTTTANGEVTPNLTGKLEDLDERRREFVFENFRDMCCGKNIYKNPFPEIYDWERIYKVQHKSMPMEARKRWFEFPKGFPGSDPYKEEYAWRDPRDIPKALFRYRRLLKEQREQDAATASRIAEKEKFQKGFDTDGQL